MKKEYLEPEVIVVVLSTDQSILKDSNGEDLTPVPGPSWS